MVNPLVEASDKKVVIANLRRVGSTARLRRPTAIRAADQFKGTRQVPLARVLGSLCLNGCHCRTRRVVGDRIQLPVVQKHALEFFFVEWPGTATS